MSSRVELSEVVGINANRVPPCLNDYWSEAMGGPNDESDVRKIIIIYAMYHRDHLISKSQAKTAIVEWTKSFVSKLSDGFIDSEVDRVYDSDESLSCDLIKSSVVAKYCEAQLCDYPRNGPPARAWLGGSDLRIEEVCEISQKRDGSQAVKFSPDKASAAIVKENSIVSTPDERIWFYRDGIYKPDGEMIIDQMLDRLVGDLYNSRMASEVHRKIVLRTLKDYGVFDCNPYHFAVENGVVDMATGKFMKHSPTFYLTQKSPVKFDKNATCPEIEQFFGSALATYDNVLSFLDIMTAKTTDLLFEYFVVMIGGGANGKSIAEELIRAFFGDETIAEVDLVTLTQNRFDRKELFKKKFIINSEVSGDVRESRWIKYISGGGRIDADQKGREHIQFRPRCIIMIDTNDPPRFADASYGFERRLVKIDFPNIFTDSPDGTIKTEKQRDPFIIKKITDPKELSGLLNLLLLRAPDVLPERKIHRRANGKTLAYEYEMQANSLAEFFDKFCELDSSNWVSKSALYENYKEFCAQANAVPKSQTQFNKFATKSLRLEESRKSVDGAFIRIFWGVQLDNVAFNEFTNPELLSSYQGATGNLPIKSLSIPALPALPALKEIIDRIVCNNIGGERGQKNQVNLVKAGTDSEKAGSNLVKKSVIKLLAIYIKQMIPKFIGMDGLTYGPYAPDEVASLPEIHAINLTEKGYARLV